MMRWFALAIVLTALGWAQDEGVVPGTVAEVSQNRMVLSLSADTPLGHRGDQVTFELTSSTSVTSHNGRGTQQDIQADRHAQVHYIRGKNGLIARNVTMIGGVMRRKK